MKEKESSVKEIAVYGKGGIGKSTISANLSAALAVCGQKVLQIGCDPKHDSTRLLMQGKNIPTVLEYLKEKNAGEACMDDVLFYGYQGIGCIEAGGPRPGVGCAGRGIISAFEFLEKHRVKQQFDFVMYDVLGDVVCGGFAVPVRREYADAIFLVTSGEYMALYAANNILRGIRNYDGDTYERVAGIIYNERCLKGEDERVQRFAQAVHLPICAKIPRSENFAQAEKEKITLMELPGNLPEKDIFLSMAGEIQNGIPLHKARPLSDEDLERIVLQTEWNKKQEKETNLQQEKEANLQEDDCQNETESSFHNFDEEQKADGTERIERAPLYGCAFNGAATTAIHLKDAIVIAHSPKSCAFYTWQNISSPGRKNLFNRGILMPSAISPHFVCTNMGENEVVFGGKEQLVKQVKKALEYQPGAVIIISSCVSGIIGDDIQSLEELSSSKTRVISILADGDMAGDYMEGIRMTMHILAEKFIDTDVIADGRCVNIVNETGISNNNTLNYEIIKGMLSRMGIGINCRFLGDANCDELKHFLKAPLNILAVDSQDGHELKEWLTEKYGCTFMEETFPVGFEAAKNWLLKIGDYFGSRNLAIDVVKKEAAVYEEEIARLRTKLSGVTVLMTTINTNMDWLLEAAYQAGMRFVWIGVLNYLHQELNITKHPEYAIEISEEVDWNCIQDKISRYHPDIVLTNYTSTVEKGDYIIDALSMTPVAGFHSALYVLRRWENLLQMTKEGEWNHDKVLFEKYFS